MSKTESGIASRGVTSAPEQVGPAASQGLEGSPNSTLGEKPRVVRVSDESAGPLPVAPVESPSLPASPPVAAAKTPTGVSWTVRISKEPGQKVQFEFGPGFGIRDVNNVVRRFRFEFLSQKRRARLAKKGEVRRAAQPQGVVNG